MNKMLKTSYAKWLCAKVFMVIFFLANGILVTQSAEAVKFRLPLSSDTSVHYYYDHDSFSGILDWKCGNETYDGHKGSDFSGGPRNRSVYAAASGTLIEKVDGYGDYSGPPNGNFVRIDHGNGVTSVYLHLNSGSVTNKVVGDYIACGELIGGVGTSGNSTGLHLHFETQLNRVAFDPYAGSCNGSTTWWVDQGTGSPSTTCENSSNTSFWTGNGSIINYHGRLLSQDAVPIGLMGSKKMLPCFTLHRGNR